MYVQEKKTKSGSYYSFTYYDKSGRRIRLKKSQHPHFTNREEAEEWAKSQRAYEASVKAKAEQRLAWKNKYYEFKSLSEKYEKFQKKQAPNSWKNNMLYLEHYVLPYFLDMKKANNANFWHLSMNEFIEWLEDEAETIKAPRRKISYSTANHIIRTLNTFLTFLEKNKLISPESNVTCEAFGKDKLNYKGYEDVLEPKEFGLIHSKLSSINPDAADFFYVLYHTGMRFNELFSLPMTALMSGELTGPVHDELQLHKIKYYGYLILESQCDSKSRVRNEDGSLTRKPLKTRKTIHAKNNRTIPIMDKECWNILARRFKAQKEAFMKKQFGIDKINYIIFDELKYNEAVRDLREAFESCNLAPKPYHNCRHSYATFLVGKTRSVFLARTILGHKSEVFDRYNHIYEMIAIKSKRDVQEIEEIA